MTDHQRYRKMLNVLGWSNKDVANITGHTYGSVRNATKPSGEIPRHFLLAIEVFEKMNK